MCVCVCVCVTCERWNFAKGFSIIMAREDGYFFLHNSDPFFLHMHTHTRTPFQHPYPHRFRGFKSLDFQNVEVLVLVWEASPLQDLCSRCSPLIEG